jgi:hypothetical protein
MVHDLPHQPFTGRQQKPCGDKCRRQQARCPKRITGSLAGVPQGLLLYTTSTQHASIMLGDALAAIEKVARRAAARRRPYRVIAASLPGNRNDQSSPVDTTG